MYDLSIKDKPRSAFIRLRERMRARKRSNDEESSSAIVPGGYAALTRVRGRLPSDGGGEEDYEDDEGGEMRRSKMRSYFLHGRLRKSSDTRSSSSLCSESSESSSRGGSLSPTAGISVVVSDLSNSPSNSSNLTADNSPEHTVAPSPQVSPDKHLFFDEACDVGIPLALSATTSADGPILLPSVCVNGNPVETSPLTHQPPSLVLQQPKPQMQTQQEPTKTLPQTSPPVKAKPTEAQRAQSSAPDHPAGPEAQVQPTKAEFKPSRPEQQLPAVGVLQKGSALSLSLQNLSRRGEEQRDEGPLDGRRWSFDKPDEEEKAAIAAELEHMVFVADDAVEVATTVSETEVHSKKRRGLFSHGRVESAGKGPEAGKEDTSHAQNPPEGKHRGWFSSKDTYSKPSQLVSHQTDFTTITLQSLTPIAMADQEPNPFTSPLFRSHANPFLSNLQQNPFFQELHTVALPSLFSPSHSQLEAPPSLESNPTPLVDLVEAGNTKGSPVEEALKMATIFEAVEVSGEGCASPSISFFNQSISQPEAPPFLESNPTPFVDLVEAGNTKGSPVEEALKMATIFEAVEGSDEGCASPSISFFNQSNSQPEAPPSLESNPTPFVDLVEAGSTKRSPVDEELQMATISEAVEVSGEGCASPSISFFSQSHTKPEAPPSLESNSTPFVDLVEAGSTKRSPVDEELQMATISDAVEVSGEGCASPSISFFSQSHTKPEAPPSLESNSTPFVDLVEAGSTKGSPVEEALQMATISEAVEVSGEGCASPSISFFSQSHSQPEAPPSLESNSTPLEDLVEAGTMKGSPVEEALKMATISEAVEGSDEGCASPSISFFNQSHSQPEAPPSVESNPIPFVDLVEAESTKGSPVEEALKMAMIFEAVEGTDEGCASPSISFFSQSHNQPEAPPSIESNSTPFVDVLEAGTTKRSPVEEALKMATISEAVEGSDEGCASPNIYFFNQSHSQPEAPPSLESNPTPFVDLVEAGTTKGSPVEEALKMPTIFEAVEVLGEECASPSISLFNQSHSQPEAPPSLESNPTPFVDVVEAGKTKGSPVDEELQMATISEAVDGSGEGCASPSISFFNQSNSQPEAPPSLESNSNPFVDFVEAGSTKGSPVEEALKMATISEAVEGSDEGCASPSIYFFNQSHSQPEAPPSLESNPTPFVDLVEAGTTKGSPVEEALKMPTIFEAVEVLGEECASPSISFFNQSHSQPEAPPSLESNPTPFVDVVEAGKTKGSPVDEELQMATISEAVDGSGEGCASPSISFFNQSNSQPEAPPSLESNSNPFVDFVEAGSTKGSPVEEALKMATISEAVEGSDEGCASPSIYFFNQSHSQPEAPPSLESNPTPFVDLVEAGTTKGSPVEEALKMPTIFEAVEVLGEECASPSISFFNQSHSQPEAPPSLESNPTPFVDVVEAGKTKGSPVDEELQMATISEAVDGSGEGCASPSISFFNQSNSQPEAPPSLESNSNPFVDFVEAGSTKGSPVEEALKMATISEAVEGTGEGCVRPSLSHSESCTEWDDFIDDRLKASKDLKTDTQKITTVPANQIKSTDQTDTGPEGGIPVSNMDDSIVSVVNPSPSDTLMIGALNSNTHAQPQVSKANYLSSNICKKDLNTFVCQEAPKTHSGSSLLQNSSIGFSELNALASHSDALSGCSMNKDKAIAVSETDLSQVLSQSNAPCSELSLFALSPEASTNSCSSFDSLEFMMNESSDQIVTDIDTVKSAKPHGVSVPYCKDLGSDNTLEPSTIITFDLLGRDHDILAPKSLQTGLSNFKPNDGTTADKAEPQLKGSITEDGSNLDAFPPALTTDPFCAFLPKSGLLIKSDPTNRAIPSSDEAMLKFPLVDMMLMDGFMQEETVSKVDAFQEVMEGPEKETVKLEPQICPVDNESNQSEPRPADNVQLHASTMATWQDLYQPTKNTSDPDFVSEPTSRITQAVVITDLFKENIFAPHHVETHTVDSNPFTHTLPVETYINTKSCPDPTETSDRGIKAQTAMSAAVPNPARTNWDSSRLWPSTVQPLTEPSGPEQLPPGNEFNLKSPFSLLDISPLAFSTPHEAVDTGGLALFSSTIMSSAPANSLLNTVPDSAPPPHIQPHPYSKESQQVSEHPTSPHPVKPLTPPDEKRSEGRSVLEKLKSTIHPGRGHHADQEVEKKPRLEGGGSYYHLNHSELVSLLLQRDAELQNEREEYERRRVLLEKREVEIKKMKFLIRDLEDYIDTLLVRIMEQTPALLQVRPKMK
ncbi:uncharacterized protein rab11fip5a isoform X2 [Brachyhypopomus gauderio]